MNTAAVAGTYPYLKFVTKDAGLCLQKMGGLRIKIGRLSDISLASSGEFCIDHSNHTKSEIGDI